MSLGKNTIKKLFLLKVKFASSSLVATIADYLIYLSLVNRVFIPEISQVISAGTGMLINFGLQKRYIFQLNRKLKTAFLISVLTSIIGLVIGVGLISLLNRHTWLHEHQIVTKLVVTGIIFFYNFYLKRFAFEKKFL